MQTIIIFLGMYCGAIKNYMCDISHNIPWGMTHGPWGFGKKRTPRKPTINCNIVCEIIDSNQHGFQANILKMKKIL